MRKRKSKKSEYEKTGSVGVNKRKFTCECGKIVLKGEGVKVSFLHTTNGFVIRRKNYCTYECAPEILKSK